MYTWQISEMSRKYMIAYFALQILAHESTKTSDVYLINVTGKVP